MLASPSEEDALNNGVEGILYCRRRLRTKGIEGPFASHRDEFWAKVKCGPLSGWSGLLEALEGSCDGSYTPWREGHHAKLELAVGVRVGSNAGGFLESCERWRLRH